MFIICAYSQEIEIYEYDLKEYDFGSKALWQADAIKGVYEKYGNLHIKYKIIKSINILNVPDVYYYEHFIDDIEYYYKDEAGEHFLGKINMLGVYDRDGDMIYDVLNDTNDIARRWKFPVQSVIGYDYEILISNPFNVALCIPEKYVPGRNEMSRTYFALDNFAEIYIDFEKNSLAVKPILF